MLKYLMKLRSRKAFTLVELVIVIAILALLMVCVAAFSTPVQRMIHATASSTDSLAVNKIIGDYIEGRLAFASRIHIVNGADAITGGGDQAIENSDGVSGGFDIVQNMISGATGGRAGVLIFHYEADPSEPEKASYQLYDVPISATSSSFIDSALNGSDIKNPVFADHFYSSGQNLIVPTLTLSENKMRGSYYASVEIIPYDISEDYIVRNASGALDPSSVYIKPTTMMDYYTNPATALSELVPQRSGAIETITFELQNITETTKWSSNRAGAGLGTGPDILIFYYTNQY